MKLIKYITDLLLGYEASDEDFSGWRVREAVRAVLLNDSNEIALMHIAKYNVYKLPGGGVDEGENLETAFVREMMEETGCEAKKTDEIGITIEKRDQWKMFQISHCYVARAKEVKSLELTEEEKDSGFSLHWIKSVDEALKLVDKNISNRYDDKYIRNRDLAILKTAKKVL